MCYMIAYLLKTSTQSYLELEVFETLFRVLNDVCHCFAYCVPYYDAAMMADLSFVRHCHQSRRIQGKTYQQYIALHYTKCK